MGPRAVGYGAVALNHTVEGRLPKQVGMLQAAE